MDIADILYFRYLPAFGLDDEVKVRFDCDGRVVVITDGLKEVVEDLAERAVLFVIGRVRLVGLEDEDADAPGS